MGPVPSGAPGIGACGDDDGSRIPSLVQCTLLGDLIDETCTRYVYRRRFGDTLALVDKRPPTIHVVPCKTCPDYSLIISGLAQVQACGEA